MISSAGVREAGRYLTELVNAGIKVRYLDIGGGLGVDYEGGGTRSFLLDELLAQDNMPQAIVGGHCRIVPRARHHDAPI